MTIDDAHSPSGVREQWAVRYRWLGSRLSPELLRYAVVHQATREAAEAEAEQMRQHAEYGDQEVVRRTVATSEWEVVRPDPDALDALCAVMHDAYERAATGAGWETNPASRKPWSDVPAANKATMRVAVAALVNWMADEPDDRDRIERLLAAAAAELYPGQNPPVGAAGCAEGS